MIPKSIDYNPTEEIYYMGNKRLPAEGSQYQWTPAMIAELERCKNDIRYFAQNYFTIVNLDRGKEKIQLYPAQERVLNIILNNRRVVLCSARQAGKTTLITIIATFLICFKEDFRVVIVANKEKSAKQILRRIKLAFELLPNYLKPGVKEWSKTSCFFDNGCSIEVCATTGDSARGDSINLMIVEEAAWIEPGKMEEFFNSVIPTISSSKKTQLILVSTPNGTNNKFYDFYNGAVEGTNGWTPARIDWWEVPGRDQEWRTLQIQTLGSEDAFNQEFGNSFTQTGKTAVHVDILKRLRSEIRNPILSIDDGRYKIWAPYHKNCLYSIGVDVGEGIGLAGSCAQVLNITNPEDIYHVASYWCDDLEPYIWARKVLMVARNYGNAPLLIERNNCGGSLIDALYHQYEYENIVSYVSKKLNNPVTRHLGIFSHTNTRYQGVTNFRYWLNTLDSFHTSDVNTIAELETFIRNPNGIYKRASGKVRDDRVMALIWAYLILEPEICANYFDIIEYNDHGKPCQIEKQSFLTEIEETANKSELLDPETVANLRKLDDITLRNLKETIIEPSQGGLRSLNQFWISPNQNQSYQELEMEELQAQGWQIL